MTPYGFPAEQYHCLLDEQPYYLVPPPLYGDDEPEPLVINPCCWFSWHGAPPADLRGRIDGTDGFLPWPNIVWVDDAATRSAWPYWLGEEYARYFYDAWPGQSLAAALPPPARWVLMRARILVPPEDALQRRRAWIDTVLAHGPRFDRGYTTLGGLIPPFHLGALRRYYRAQTRLGAFQLGDSQVSERYVAHNEPVAQYLHRQLATVIGDIARIMAQPSYAYLAAYQSGAALERHVEREQCEYSIALCIDAVPEPDGPVGWPIDLDTTDGRLRIWQSLGDGLLYRGCYVPQSREPLPAGHNATYLLLHYVEHGFAGPLD